MAFMIQNEATWVRAIATLLCQFGSLSFEAKTKRLIVRTTISITVFFDLPSESKKCQLKRHSNKSILYMNSPFIAATTAFDGLDRRDYGSAANSSNAAWKKRTRRKAYTHHTHHTINYNNWNLSRAAAAAAEKSQRLQPNKRHSENDLCERATDKKQVNKKTGLSTHIHECAHT